MDEQVPLMANIPIARKQLQRIADEIEREGPQAEIYSQRIRNVIETFMVRRPTRKKRSGGNG